MQEPISKLQEEEHQQELLTRKSFDDWVNKLPQDKFDKLWLEENENSFVDCYIKEHGLDLDSVFTD
jgi:hypothetical protein